MRPSQKGIQGLTLIELVISMAIFLGIVLTAVTVLINFASLEVKNRKINTAETDLNSLIAYMHVLSHTAVNLRYFSGSLDGLSSPSGGAGFVRDFSYIRDADLAGRNSTTLMFFAREMQKSQLNSATLSSTLRPTGVFFEKKNATNDSTRRPGRILIDLGEDNTSGDVSLAEADLVFNNISDVIISEPQIAEGNVLTGIKMTVVAIYPVMSVKTNLACLGPTGDISDGTICNANTTNPYKTVRRSFYLNFPNNKRLTSISSSEFGDGLYRFQPLYGF